MEVCFKVHVNIGACEHSEKARPHTQTAVHLSSALFLMRKRRVAAGSGLGTGLGTMIT